MENFISPLRFKKSNSNFFPSSHDATFKRVFCYQYRFCHLPWATTLEKSIPTPRQFIEQFTKKIDQSITLKMEGHFMMFLPYRCFMFSIIYALYTAFYFVKDDLVSHILNKFAEPIFLDIGLLFCL